MKNILFSSIMAGHKNSTQKKKVKKKRKLRMLALIMVRKIKIPTRVLGHKNILSYYNFHIEYAQLYLSRSHHSKVGKNKAYL